MVSKQGLSVAAYFFGVIGGVVVYLVTEKKDRFIRFHAIQSILFNISAGLIWMILAALLVPWHLIGGVGWPVFAGSFTVFGVYGLLLFIVWIILIVNAWNKKKYKLPFLGDLAEDWSK